MRAILRISVFLCIAGGGAVLAQPSPKDLYDSAVGDFTSGKLDAAASESADFVRLYPADPMAAEAQLLLSEIHMAQQKFNQAATDLDLFLQRHPNNRKAPDAYFLKGLALRNSAHYDLAVSVWMTLIQKYPDSERASQARRMMRTSQ